MYKRKGLEQSLKFGGFGEVVREESILGYIIWTT